MIEIMLVVAQIQNGFILESQQLIHLLFGKAPPLKLFVLGHKLPHSLLVFPLILDNLPSNPLPLFHQILVHFSYLKFVLND
jgi:hypothetical protein